MYQERFWNLLAKHLSGEASPEEFAELQTLLKEHPELSYSAQHVTDLWKTKGDYDVLEAERAFKKHKQVSVWELPDELNASSLTKSGGINYKSLYTLRSILWIGMVITVIGVGLFIWRNGKKEGVGLNKQTAEVFTRPGSRTKLILPDGSEVWLNAGSRLTYQQPFGDTSRAVNLIGEAFFDVVKSNKPFIIYTGGVQIKVLGTAFNVRSYPNEKKIETSLVRGRVEVTLDKSPEKKYILKPNEKLTLNTDDEIVGNNHKKLPPPLAVVSNLRYLDSTTIAETSWVENKLVFVDESFDDIAKRMERWYGVTIIFKNDKVKNERLTGVFEKETVWQALEALQLTTSFHFSLRDDTIIITN